MFILLLVLLILLNPPTADAELNLNVDDYHLVVRKKLWRLHALANRTIFVHEHIPKVGGTALSFALSSECVCVPRKVFLQDSCTQCPHVRGRNGFTFSYTVSRASGWVFGIHPPLAKFFAMFTSEKKRTKVARHGLLPMYVVMLREPFARFISEVRNWVGKQQVGCDWSIWYKSKVSHYCFHKLAEC